MQQSVYEYIYIKQVGPTLESSSNLKCISFLTCPVLTFLDLNSPDLICPDLTCPDLTCADLTCPYLTCPNLTRPDLPFRYI